MGLQTLVAGDALRYRVTISKSRWYFLALAESHQIFMWMSALPSAGGDEQLPYISHTMNEPYYKAFELVLYFVQRHVYPRAVGRKSFTGIGVDQEP